MSIGIAARHIGLKPIHLERVIIYIALPILLFTETMKIQLDSSVIGEIGLLSLVYLTLIFIASYIPTRRFEIREKGTIIFNTMFYNGIFLPFPLILAFYGDLSVAIIIGVPLMIIRSTLGTFLASYWGHGRAGKKFLLRALMFPPLWGFILGVLARPIFAAVVPSQIFDWLSTLGLLAIYLSMILAGLVIPLSKDSLLIFRNRVPGIITLYRFVVSPILAIALIVLFNQVGLAKNSLLLNSFMPPGFTNTVIATSFGLDARATSQSIFLPTLLSLAIIFALRFTAIL